MLGNKPKPMIEILTGSFISGNRSGTTSPKSPRTFDIGAVGLGIVAELEKAGDLLTNNRALFSRNLSPSIPIPVKNSLRNKSEEIMGMESSFEEYTIVTCHGLNKSYTKVYGDGRKGNHRFPFRISEESVSKRPSVFHISPPKSEDIALVPPSDFLSSCDLCNKKLHNEDIYMYRGEKAFCSTECRYKQIVMDERKEKYCSSDTSIRAPVEVASSPCTNGQIFTTGILAT